MPKQKSIAKKTIQTPLAGKELEDFNTVKDYFSKKLGFRSDSEITRFLILRTADNIKNGTPLTILPTA